MKRFFLTALMISSAASGCAKPDEPAPQPSVPRLIVPTGASGGAGDVQRGDAHATDASRAFGALPAYCRDPKHPDKVVLKTVPFDLDQSELRPDAQQILSDNAECLRAAPHTRVAVEGHCDERGTTEYNLTLGEQRASAVVKHLERLGVDRSRLRPLSKGKAEPVCREASDPCYAKNRRVELH